VFTESRVAEDVGPDTMPIRLPIFETAQRVTDGTYTYLRPGIRDDPLFLYSTTMMNRYDRHRDPMLFDVTDDPDQETDLAGDHPAEARMRHLLTEGLDALSAPAELYTRLGLERS